MKVEDVYTGTIRTCRHGVVTLQGAACCECERERTAACVHGTEGAFFDGALCSACVGERNGDTTRELSLDEQVRAAVREAVEPLRDDTGRVPMNDQLADRVRYAVLDVLERAEAAGHIGPGLEVTIPPQSPVALARRELQGVTFSAVLGGIVIDDPDVDHLEAMRQHALDLLDEACVGTPDREHGTLDAQVDVVDNIATLTFTLTTALRRRSP